MHLGIAFDEGSAGTPQRRTVAVLHPRAFGVEAVVQPVDVPLLGPQFFFIVLSRHLSLTNLR